MSQRLDRIETRGPDSRYHAEEDADACREPQADCERPPGERNRKAGCVADGNADAAAEDDAENAAKGGQDRRFRQKLQENLLPPGAERTVQYADFLESVARGGSPTTFVLVTIPSEVSRGVVARSIAALAKERRHVLGYIENMSGYYCRDCRDVKPLFTSRAPGAPEARDLGIPCLGTVPFDPELARHCDEGTPFAALR